MSELKNKNRRYFHSIPIIYCRIDYCYHSVTPVTDDKPSFIFYIFLYYICIFVKVFLHEGRSVNSPCSIIKDNISFTFFLSRICYEKKINNNYLFLHWSIDQATCTCTYSHLIGNDVSKLDTILSHSHFQTTIKYIWEFMGKGYCLGYAMFILSIFSVIFKTKFRLIAKLFRWWGIHFIRHLIISISCVFFWFICCSGGSGRGPYGLAPLLLFENLSFSCVKLTKNDK